MADPATLAAVSIGMQAIGGISAAQGAKQQAAATASMMNYQAQVAQNNQLIANQNADIARQVGEAQVAQKRLQTAATIGSIVAHEASSGLDVNKGSPLDVRSSAAEMGELDALTIRDAASRQARGYEVEGVNYGAQAGLDVATGKNALEAGNLQAFTSLVGGASGVSDKWLRFQQSGVFGSSPNPILAAG